MVRLPVSEARVTLPHLILVVYASVRGRDTRAIEGGSSQSSGLGLFLSHPRTTNEFNIAAQACDEAHEFPCLSPLSFFPLS